MKMKDQTTNIKDVEVIAAVRRFHILDSCSSHFAFEKGLVFMVLLSALAGVALAQGRTRVYAKVDSDTTIYPGQTFVYSVVVAGGKPSRVDVSAIAQFNPQRAGGGSSMVIVSGQATISYSENYAILAERPGTMVRPGGTVVVDGRTYTTNAVEVTVSAPGTTDRLDLEVTLSETKCYVGQPVVITVRWIVKAQVRDWAFDVPVFQSDDFFIEDLPDAVAVAHTAGRAQSLQLGAEHHALTVGVDRRHDVPVRPAGAAGRLFDAVVDQSADGVEELLVHPVAHRHGPFGLPGARHQDGPGSIGGGVEEVIHGPPRDSAAFRRRPGVEDPPGQYAFAAGAADAEVAPGAFDREPPPGHVLSLTHI